MSSIFIIGATGFAGLPIAVALRAAGYIVYALARTPEKANLLARNEILPIVGDAKDLAKILPKTTGVVIDVSGLYSEAAGVLEQLKKIGGGRKPTDPKIGFIYTSGAWVYGNSPVPISEATILGVHGQPAAIAGWRPDFENQVLASRDVLDAVVIRPSQLYGGNGTILTQWLDPIYKAAKAGENTATVFGTPDTKIVLTHKDDLATLYVKVVDKLTVVAASTHPLIHSASYQERLGTLLQVFANEVGFKGEIAWRAPSNQFEEATTTDANFTGQRARGLLDWVPRQVPFSQGIQIYAASYIAWKEGGAN